MNSLGESSCKVKIFGERNTGTNLISQLMQDNIDCEVCPGTAKEIVNYFRFKAALASRVGIFLGKKRLISRELYIDKCFERQNPLGSWKHCATSFDDVSNFEGAKVIFAIRSPASWLLALYQRPHNRVSNHLCESFSQFLMDEVECTRKHRLNRVRVSPVDLWNLKSKSYLRLMEQLKRAGIPYAVVNFENLVTNQVDAMGEAFDVLNVACKGRFRPVVSSTKDTKKSYEWYKEYYGKRLWLSDIDRDSARIIRSEIDWSIANKFGYSSELEMPLV